MKDQLILKDARVFDENTNEFTRGLDILIEDGLIRDVGRVALDNGGRRRVVDCRGKFALFGLFDCHTHLTMLANQPDEEKKAILTECSVREASMDEELDKQVLGRFLAAGVTQLRDLGGPLAVLKAMSDRIRNHEYSGPELFYAGPMLEKSPLTAGGNNERWPGFTVAVDSTEDAENIIDELVREGASVVKAFAKWDIDVLKHLLQSAAKASLPLTIDPGPTFFHSIPVDKAIDLDITCVEHGKSPWLATLKDDLRVEHDSLTAADPKAKKTFVDKMLAMGAESIAVEKLNALADRMVEKNVCFCPTLHVFKYNVEHPEVFQDNNLEDRRRIFRSLLEVSLFITSVMAKRGVRILVGQDGWNPIFTALEMQMLVETGLPAAETIKGATVYPAEWLGVADEYGSIAPGKRANILILDEDPLQDMENAGAVYAVIKDGEVMLESQTL